MLEKEGFLTCDFGMDTRGRLVAGSHNRNEFIVINADEPGRVRTYQDCVFAVFFCHLLIDFSNTHLRIWSILWDFGFDKSLCWFGFGSVCLEHLFFVIWVVLEMSCWL